jgi:hypothetical protein
MEVDLIVMEGDNVKGIGLKLFTGKVGIYCEGGRSGDNLGRRYFLRNLNPSSAEYEADVMRTPT